MRLLYGHIIHLPTRSSHLQDTARLLLISLAKYLQCSAQELLGTLDEHPLPSDKYSASVLRYASRRQTTQYRNNMRSYGLLDVFVVCHTQRFLYFPKKQLIL